MKTIHRQVMASHPREGRIEVDRSMRPLLRRLWALGIDTFMSCEDTQGWVWIEFTGTADAEHFLTIVANHDRGSDQDDDVDDGMYLRMTNPLRPASWTYKVLPADVNNLDEPRTLPAGSTAEFMLSVSVRFPRSDHPRVLAAVRRAVRARRTIGGSTTTEIPTSPKR